MAVREDGNADKA